jgi:beta-N-acetylhexosaminidase
MIRTDMGFRGAIVSDDLGTAKQVAAWSPGTRAVKFLSAGGDLVLTVNPSQASAARSTLQLCAC